MMMSQSPADPVRDVALLAGRLLLVALFVTSGFGKLGQVPGIADALQSKGVPLPLAAAWAGTVLEIAGALAIVVGYRTRLAAIGLIVFTVTATVLFHDFWAASEAARDGETIHFLKNVGLVGGFLLLAAAGPGRFSLDLFPTARNGRARLHGELA